MAPDVGSARPRLSRDDRAAGGYAGFCAAWSAACSVWACWWRCWPAPAAISGAASLQRRPAERGRAAQLPAAGAPGSMPAMRG